MWIVATPIGSLDDLGPRARRILASVEIILAEDTRVTRALLGHAGVAAGRRLRSFHDHNERARLPWVLAQLEQGQSVALVSDAGTPAIWDPGWPVREARRRDRICSVPGPSAFTAALAAAGAPPLPAVLAGFLPPQRAGRRRRIAELAGWTGTVVVLLSPHRLAEELGDLAAGLGAQRAATLLAELSKLHEQRTAAPSPSSQPVEMSLVGEYVVVIGPARFRREVKRTGEALYERLQGAASAAGAARTARRLDQLPRVFASLLGDERIAQPAHS
jgi:16S rRNA (cytidine1402-2'-O)-methyltransferase